ncbi:2445_t:CDS:2 [Diversispora eburnea]|uniref:2445_t:CDS:1 n=1 Tax=Diversispora eburnea TaxID=1213867 RepID=A0A9N9A2N8_9GLOM|nr:2445_t:CDS:2 [Diversispora eburnea]
MIHIPYIIDNNKNITPVNRLIGDSQNSQNSQNSIMPLESLDSQRFNNLTVNSIEQNMSTTGFCSIDSATVATNSQLFSPNKSYTATYQTYHKTLAENQAMALAQLLVPKDELLRAAVNIYGPHKWSLVATNIPNRTPMQCSARWVGALNPSILKGRWTAQEDSTLTETVQQYLNAIDSQGNPQPLPWNKVSKRIPQRTGAQCQARWTEALDPNIKKGKWSPSEDEILKDGVKIYGRCWIRIAEMIEGRTQQAKIKNESTNNNTSNSTNKNQNVVILTPPTTTPSTPAQSIKNNYSSSPTLIQGGVMTPSQIGNSFANITHSQFNTSPELYQSPVFSSPSTPAESPCFSSNIDIPNFFTNGDSTNFEHSQIIFQSPQANPLCFYGPKSNHTIKLWDGGDVGVKGTVRDCLFVASVHHRPE